LEILKVDCLASWIDWFADIVYLGNNLLQWLGLLGVLLASLIAGRLFSFFMQKQSKRLVNRKKESTVLGLLLASVSKPGSLLIFAAGLFSATMFLSLEVSETVDFDLAGFWTNVCRTIGILAGGWFIYRMIDIVEHFLVRWTSRTSTTLDDQLVPLVRKTLRIFVIIVAGLFIAGNVFKWDIAALLAGLGIGGLAFALAAKDMLANLFGSVTIFADRPFQMGDRIRVKGHDGEVVEVGFRSTKILTLSGHLVTLPNAVVANEAVENVSRRPYIKRSLELTVTYDTTPEKLARAVEIVKEMLAGRSEHFPPDRPGRVHFTDFNAVSLGISVTYWYTPPEWEGYLQFSHDFNMELLKRFNDEGIEFAFPTQTLYLHEAGTSEA